MPASWANALSPTIGLLIGIGMPVICETSRLAG